MRIEYRHRPDEPHLPKPVVCPLCEKCVNVCTPGALIVSKEGYLTLERSLCDACGECLDACPLELIVMDAEGKPLFCDMCQGEPQCVSWCKQQAIVIVESKGAKGNVA